MHRQERQKLKDQKKAHKRALKNRDLYINKRNVLISCILDAQLPRWGSLKISMVSI